MTRTHTVAVDFDGVTAELPELPDDDAKAALNDAAPNADGLADVMVGDADVDAKGALADHFDAVKRTLLNADPVPGALDGLQSLADAGHDVVIVTNRPECLRELTAAWLDKHGVAYDDLRCVGDSCTKGELDGVDVVIDDTPANALAGAAHASLGVLFARAWTPTDAAERRAGVRVAESWDDVVATLSGVQADARTVTA